MGLFPLDGSLLASTSVVDRILVFDDGRIVEDGSHEQLMKLDGVYAAFQKANDFWLPRNVMSALGMILGYIHKHHGKRKITFRVPKGK